MASSGFSGAQTLGKALDATNLVWTTGGDAVWITETTNTYDGVDAVQSGMIHSNQTSWLQTTVIGPATVSFWYATHPVLPAPAAGLADCVPNCRQAFRVYTAQINEELQAIEDSTAWSTHLLSSGNAALICGMDFFIQRSELRDIYDKVAASERISDADALRLFESRDLNAIGGIADLARQKKVGNRASYIVNRYINYSNYCILSCQFCSFARKKRDADGFQFSIEEIVQKAREALKLGITELHIVGGLHPSLPFSYYKDMLRELKQLDVRLQLKCFTAIEVLHLAWLAKKSVEQTLQELKEAGLDSLTGGGAEIFRKEVRSAIAKGKESAEEYLDVHRTWHKMGGRSTCTMLYGHIESLPDRVDHLRHLRALQDETHGFCGFVPLAYQPRDNDIPVETPPTGFDSLRTIAISRIYLDNFDHITAYWVGLGLKLAQVALSYGADDLHGTIIEEYIFHMAGATSPQLQTEADMLKAIREAGRTPVQRNTFYEPIRVLEDASAGEASKKGTRSEVLEDNLATA